MTPAAARGEDARKPQMVVAGRRAGAVPGDRPLRAGLGEPGVRHSPPKLGIDSAEHRRCAASADGLEQAHPPEAACIRRRRTPDDRGSRSRALRRRAPAGASRGSRHRSAGRRRSDGYGRARCPALPCSAASAMIARSGKSAPRLVALMARQMEAARLIVDMRDPQAFAARIGVGEAAREEGPGCGQPVELQREFGTLIPHARSLVRDRHARTSRTASETGCNSSTT